MGQTIERGKQGREELNNRMSQRDAIYAFQATRANVEDNASVAATSPGSCQFYDMKVDVVNLAGARIAALPCNPSTLVYDAKTKLRRDLRMLIDVPAMVLTVGERILEDEISLCDQGVDENVTLCLYMALTPIAVTVVDSAGPRVEMHPCATGATGREAKEQLYQLIDTPATVLMLEDVILQDDTSLKDQGVDEGTGLTFTTPLVVDAGSAMCKAGFTGDDKPQAVFPSTVATKQLPQHGVALYSQQHTTQQYVVGLAPGITQTRERGEVVNWEARCPIERGIVRDWGAMEEIWRHTFCNQLHVDLKRHPVLLTESLVNPKANRERMTEIMFEDFSVPALYVATPAVLSLYASERTTKVRRTTGVVVDSGEHVSYTVPVYEGYAISHAIMSLDIAGRQLTEYMIDTLIVERKVTDRLRTCDYSVRRKFSEAVRQMKEEICYVALDFDIETQAMRENSGRDYTYAVPDHTMSDLLPTCITVGSERFRCPEVLFQPILLNFGSEHGQGQRRGIHFMTFQSIIACEVDLHKDLYSNVVLAGGTTMFDGFRSRMKRELMALAPSSMEVEVVAPLEHSAWIGGSILSRLKNFQNMWISLSEYRASEDAQDEDSGPRIVHRKCF